MSNPYAKNKYSRAKKVGVGALLGSATALSGLSWLQGKPIYTKNLVTTPIKGSWGTSWPGNTGAGRQIQAMRQAGRLVKVTKQPAFVYGQSANVPVSYTYTKPGAKPSGYTRNWPKGADLAKVLGMKEWWTIGIQAALCALAVFKGRIAASILICGGSAVAHSRLAQNAATQALIASAAATWAAITADRARYAQEIKTAEYNLKKEGVNVTKMSAAALEKTAKTTGQQLNASKKAEAARHANAQKHIEAAQRHTVQTANNAAAGRIQQANIANKTAKREIALARIQYEQRNKHHYQTLALEARKAKIEAIRTGKEIGLITESKAKELLLETLQQIDAVANSPQLGNWNPLSITNAAAQRPRQANRQA